ncbi:Hypothetical predicted protein [Mytilus galloprovincialis]|uniref:Uncharacterized protein n=1 Tax=Mytilus galloprovincialis TaxID=29158 RepID=A0A8B6DBD3_MYTGA|nr:Hypothetical predicted protein [Mytilus galloprovincialis]
MLYLELMSTSSVTPGRSSTTTIPGCGSASGFAVPPYFVFEGKRINNELMNGATPGAVGSVSDSGWSNINIVRQYLTDHFLKYIPGRNNDNTVINQDQLKPSEVFTRNEECKETTETKDEPKTDEIQMQVVEVDMHREVTEAVEIAVSDVVEDMQDHDTAVPHFFAERINKPKCERI